MGLQKAHLSHAYDALIVKPVFAGNLPLLEGVLTVELKADLGILLQQVNLPAPLGAVKIKGQLAVHRLIPEIQGDQIGIGLVMNGKPYNFTF